MYNRKRPIALRRHELLFPFSDIEAPIILPPGTWVPRATNPPDIVRWWDPKDGNDGNNGTSPGNAWKTLDHAVSETLSDPGANVIGVPNKIYTISDTGLTNDFYMSRLSGISTGPGDDMLWIRAVDEREAIFESNGEGVFNFHNCHWITVWGITGDADTNTSAGGAPEERARGVFNAQNGSSHIRYIRGLVSRVNLGRDQHGFRFNDVSFPYVEECEAYRFFRHGFNFQRCDMWHAKRCYANARMANAAAGIPDDHDEGDNFNEGFSTYRVRFGLLENCIVEGGSDVRIQCDHDPSGVQRGHSNLYLGGIGWGAGRNAGTVFPTDFRSAGSHFANLVKHWLMLETQQSGTRVETDFTWFRNISFIRSSTSGSRPAFEHRGFRRNSDFSSEYEALTGEWPPHARSLIRNSIFWDTQSSQGAYVEALRSSSHPLQRDLSYCAFWNNAGNDSSLASSTFSNSLHQNPDSGNYGLNLSGHQQLIYVPSGHPFFNQGLGSGIDGHIGATILHRYEGEVSDGQLPTEVLTGTPLWNPENGQFPHGAVIPGYNDMDSPGTHQRNRSLYTLHTRLNLAGKFPAGYGQT